MHWIVIAAVLAAIALSVVVATWIGRHLPEAHQATVKTRLDASPARIWSLITNFADAPNWRSGLRQVERLADRDGLPVWVEVHRRRRQPLAFEQVDPPHRLVLRSDGDELAFAGTWTFELAAEGDGTELTIHEAGLIRPPFLRFMARYVFGYDGAMKRYLRDLGRKVALPKAR